MSVSPANQLVTLGGGKLVTCVRQRTAMDTIATLCVRCDTDTLLRPVMQDLLGGEGFVAWEGSLLARRVAEDAARVYSRRRYGDVFSMKV